MSLRVCESCDRHTRSSDATCPYCGAGLPSVTSAAGGVTSALGRLGRAALTVGGATAFSAALVACYGGPTPPRAAPDAKDLDAPAPTAQPAADAGATAPANPAK
jgi:hypothetical protein